MSKSARLLLYEPAEPAWNMAVDRALLDLAGQPTLRFYGWQPHAISLGHFQRDPTELQSLAAHGLPLVRQMTGGGAIVHAFELTYSICLALDHPWIAGADRQESYARLHTPIQAALQRLGIPTGHRDADQDQTGQRNQALLCFARKSSLDLLAQGKKLVGSAQRRTRTHLLQHGSILLDAHPLQAGTADTRSLLGSALDPVILAEFIASEAAHGPLGSLTPGSLSQAEKNRANQLRSALSVRA